MFKYYIYVFSISIGISFILTPIIRKLSLIKGFVDKPNNRKVHRANMPTLGGIAIGVSFLSAMFLILYFSPAQIQKFWYKFIGLCIGGVIILLLGIYDDIKGIDAKIKFSIQTFVAIILVIYGFKVEQITNPIGGGFSLGILGLFFTIFWIIGIINAINLLDGLDGLAAGVTGIVAFFLFLSAITQDNFVVAFLSLALVGSIAGFLPFNFYPAKIFMGDTGSMFLGLILSALAIEGYAKSKTAIALFMPIIAMSIPIIDTCLSIVRRLLKRKHIFQADREHIHHKLLIEEKSQRRAVLSLYFLSCCYGLISLSFSGFRGIFSIMALLLVGLFTISWMKRSGFLEFSKKEGK